GLGSGLPAARSDDRLPLLPSGSDGVHGPFLHRTRSSTPPRAWRIREAGPREGIQPRWSGLRVQGTASSPPSTTVTMLSATDGRRATTRAPTRGTQTSPKVALKATGQAVPCAGTTRGAHAFYR